ncbi:alpha/beta hydrolase-fold protein [Silvimonas sp. JCM 19000]
MRRDHSIATGSVHRLHIDSHVLADNFLGDAPRRIVDVYVPAGHDGRGLPLLVDLVGYTGGGPAHTNWKGLGESAPERLDRLMASGAMQPAVVAFPDCFTRLGGNQYVNSAVMGRWEDFLIDEMLPTVEQQFACGGAGRRGVFGKSSGGFGAMWHVLKRSDIWSAAACHSGDMAFDIVYLPDVYPALMTLEKHGGIEGFMRYFEAAKKPSDDDIHALMMLAMGATYDPAPDQYLGLRLPVDLDTGELIAERWHNWLAFDPVRLVDTQIDALKGLKGLYIDCGTLDQYNMIFGHRQLRNKLTAAGVPHRYEEFVDNHSSIDYRMDISLPFLAQALRDA